MSKEVFENIRLISLLIIGVPFIMALFKFKKLNSVQRLLMYLISVIVLVEIISLFLWHKEINNLVMYHIYTVIEFIMISMIYTKVLTSLFPKYVFKILTFLFIIFAFLNVQFFQNIYTFNSNTITVSGIIIIIFSLSYFYALLQEIKYSALENNPMFWINSGFLIYFSTNLILFFINNSMFKASTEATYLVWGLHAIINIVLTLFYTIALWVTPKKL